MAKSVVELVLPAFTILDHDADVETLREQFLPLDPQYRDHSQIRRGDEAGAGQGEIAYGRKFVEIKIKALYEIQWVIIFHFPTKKINHVDKVLYVSIASSAPFG